MNMLKIKLPSFLLAAELLTARTSDAPQKLIARAMRDTPIFRDLRELCDGIGGRPTGSTDAAKAIEWGAHKFRAISY